MNFTKECFFNFNRLRHFLTSIKQIEREKHRTMLTALHKKMKFSIQDVFSKGDQIRSFLRIW